MGSIDEAPRPPASVEARQGALDRRRWSRQSDQHRQPPTASPLPCRATPPRTAAHRRSPNSCVSLARAPVSMRRSAWRLRCRASPRGTRARQLSARSRALNVCTTGRPPLPRAAVFHVEQVAQLEVAPRPRSTWNHRSRVRDKASTPRPCYPQCRCGQAADKSRDPCSPGTRGRPVVDTVESVVRECTIPFVPVELV